MLKAWVLARVHLGTNGTAHVLVVAELRPRAASEERAESHVQAAFRVDDVTMGSTPAHLRKLSVQRIR